jgi:hypothetical protein
MAVLYLETFAFVLAAIILIGMIRRSKGQCYRSKFTAAIKTAYPDTHKG